MKNILFPTLAVLLGLLATALVLEAALRFLPVNRVMGSLPVNDENPILRYEPDRTLVWSDGPFLSLANTVRVNNHGFINQRDYDPADPRPLAAVIGDSFVEALMVDPAETLQARLDAALGHEARVYSFGRSGAPLSQYLAMAGWVRETFAPDRYVVVIVGNDFDESLRKYKSAAGMHAFQDGPDGLELVRMDYEPGPLAAVAPYSRLLLYALNNLKVTELPASLRARFSGPGEFAGNVAVSVDQARVEDSYRALDAFLQRLAPAAGVDPADVLLVVDGVRNAIYERDNGLVRESYFGLMRTALLERARNLGYRVLDLQPVFEAEYLEHGLPFEFSANGHWTGYGHGVAARAVLDTGFLDGMTREAAP